MLMIRAIIRPEKLDTVLTALSHEGFVALTVIDVYGRGRQGGVTIGEVHYHELPKQMIMIVVKDEDKDKVVETIMRTARTGEGHPGDGRIFITPVEQSIPIRTGKPEC